MVTTKIDQEVKGLVAQDKLDEAFQTLFTHFEDEQVILQSGRYESLKKDIQSGTITLEQARSEKARIRKEPSSK